MTTPTPKRDFNLRCMKRFWTKAQLAVPNEDLETLRITWRASYDMEMARERFDKLWENLIVERHTTISAEEPGLPNVAAEANALSIDFSGQGSALDFLSWFLWRDLPR